MLSESAHRFFNFGSSCIMMPEFVGPTGARFGANSIIPNSRSLMSTSKGAGYKLNNDNQLSSMATSRGRPDRSSVLAIRFPSSLMER